MEISCSVKGLILDEPLYVTRTHMFNTRKWLPSFFGLYDLSWSSNQYCLTVEKRSILIGSFNDAYFKQIVYTNPMFVIVRE